MGEKQHICHVAVYVCVKDKLTPILRHIDWRDYIVIVEVDLTKKLQTYYPP